MKKTSSAVIAFVAIALTFGVAASFTDGFTNNPFATPETPDAGIITDPGTDLNARSIKMRNVGDTFTLTASVNEDATVDSVTFISSDESAISVTRISNQSCKLTKLKDFEGLVTIYATSDDPLVNLSTSCNVRSYNTIKYFNGDFAIESMIDSSGEDITEAMLGNSNKLILIPGVTYSFNWFLQTTFSHLNMNPTGTNGYQEDGTFIGVEEEDMLSLKNLLESALNNEITSFTQDYYVEDESNTIQGTFTYTNEIDFSSLTFNEDEGYYANPIVFGGKTFTLGCYKYAEASELTLDNSETLVI